MARNHTYLGLSSDTPHFVELQRSQIKPHPDQPRRFIRPGYLDELAASIERSGQLDPIKVLVNEDERDTYIMVDGQCRLKALESIGKDTVLSVILPGGDALELALILNSQREGNHPLDDAMSMALLMERYKYTQEQLAKTLGKKRSTIVETLLLNDLPEEVKEECRKIEIGKTHLVTLVRLMDRQPEFQKLYEQILQGRPPTVREAQSLQRKGRKQATAADVPKALKPMYRVIEITHRVQEQLAKITPSSIGSGQPERLQELTEKLKELREIHQQIGKTITKLTKESAAAAASERIDSSEDASEETSPLNVSAENNIHVK